MSSRFSAGLKKLKEETQGAVVPPPAVAAAVPANGDGPAPVQKAVQRDRYGKVNISGFFEKPVRKQLAMLAVEQERSQVDMLAEALNLLFEKYGKSPIAKA